MKPTINPTTVEQLHRYLGILIEQGHKNLPVVGTDSRAYFPIQVFDVLDQSGYTAALQIQVKVDAKFATEDGLCSKSASTLAHWNEEAKRVQSTCGAFA